MTTLKKLFILILMVGLFSACNSNSKSGEEESTDEVASADEDISMAMVTGGDGRFTYETPPTTDPPSMQTDLLTGDASNYNVFVTLAPGTDVDSFTLAPSSSNVQTLTVTIKDCPGCTDTTKMITLGPQDPLGELTLIVSHNGPPPTERKGRCPYGEGLVED